jgi:ABC-type antimicrobial peptide transport system permease subunit
VAEGLRRALTDDEGLRVGRVEPLTASVRSASATSQFSMSLVSAFAGVAIVLAIASLYGLTALIIGRRTKEIAVRFALGARSWDVARVLLQRTLGLSAAGIVCGVTMSLGLTSALQSALFGVAANDVRTYVAVAIGFVLVSLVVGGAAVRRVFRIDPMRALQVD